MVASNLVMMIVTAITIIITVVIATAMIGSALAVRAGSTASSGVAAISMSHFSACCGSSIALTTTSTNRIR